MPALPDSAPEVGQAFRCSLCSLNFPRRGEFSTCPRCGEPCTGYSNVSAMPESEAFSILYHAQFDRYYEEQHTPNLELTEDEEVMVALSVLAEKEERLRRLAQVMGRAVGSAGPPRTGASA